MCWWAGNDCRNILAAALLAAVGPGFAEVNISAWFRTSVIIAASRTPAAQRNTVSVFQRVNDGTLMTAFGNLKQHLTESSLMVGNVPSEAYKVIFECRQVGGALAARRDREVDSALELEIGIFRLWAAFMSGPGQRPPRPAVSLSCWGMRNGLSVPARPPRRNRTCFAGAMSVILDHDQDVKGKFGAEPWCGAAGVGTGRWAVRNMSFLHAQLSQQPKCFYRIQSSVAAPPSGRSNSKYAKLVLLHRFTEHRLVRLLPPVRCSSDIAVAFHREP